MESTPTPSTSASKSYITRTRRALRGGKYTNVESGVVTRAAEAATAGEAWANPTNWKGGYPKVDR